MHEDNKEKSNENKRKILNQLFPSLKKISLSDLK